LADEISDWSDWRVDVVDENDSVVFVLPFEQVLRQRKLNLLTSAL
jgi:hypothetical protein